ncbi:N-acetylglucosamine-6-phosphate deacetylase [Suicoccus acidiformans]|uniref:N-acetylglucosamine-6-phosphate deacetylase n=1 Tax=Suicoccus acidiformans TaxID=2036206 RepID=UPI001F09D140|nr:N-acetylglucosamine-6-phosphate deacetylase [Suicoccus acidiformans]
MNYYIHGHQIILEDQVLEDAYLKIKEGKFDGVVQTAPEGAEIVDYSNYILAPGLVDTHIHGYKSYDVMDNDAQGLEEISKGLLACGVTSWLPTTLTAPAEELEAVCQTVAEHYQSLSGAKVRGIFLEGPFFTEKYKGAQNEHYMMDPSVDLLKAWHQASAALVNKIAIAPERDGVTDFIHSATNLGVYTALAHSDATYAQAMEAVEAGANIFIHTFNGMSGLHHREPGMVGAALNAGEGVYAELICDGFHVHPAAASIVMKCRGTDETVLVTDCMRAGGMGEGDSMLGELPVVVKDGQARLKDGGNLAGSILELIDGVANVVQWGIASLPEAVRMASLAPAKSVGIEHLCGKIAPGYEADFIVIDDTGQLQATYLDGVKRYDILDA